MPLLHPPPPHTPTPLLPGATSLNLFPGVPTCSGCPLPTPSLPRPPFKVQDCKPFLAAALLPPRRPRSIGPARSRTLHACIRTSYGRLGPPPRLLYSSWYPLSGPLAQLSQWRPHAPRTTCLRTNFCCRRHFLLLIRIPWAAGLITNLEPWRHHSRLSPLHAHVSFQPDASVESCPEAPGPKPEHSSEMSYIACLLACKSVWHWHARQGGGSCVANTSAARARQAQNGARQRHAA
jgi:hypothetical protein